MIPTSQPNAAQKRFMEQVRALGSIVSGGPAVVHHAAGRKARHNKIEIGHWWLVPLTDEEHKALHNGETFGFESRKEFEKDSFERVMYRLPDDSECPPREVVAAIMGYHR